MQPTTELLHSFYDVDYTSYHMPIITVYYNTLDFPHQFVARLFDLDNPTPFAVVKDSLLELREAIPHQFTNIGRNEEDVSVIVEVWI